MLTATVLAKPELLDMVPKLQDAEIYGNYGIFMRGLLPRADSRKVSDVAVAAGRQILQDFAIGQDPWTNMNFRGLPWVTE
jgi:hypothetical protein